MRGRWAPYQKWRTSAVRLPTFLPITVLPAGIVTAIPHGEVNQIPAAARVLDSSVLGFHLLLRENTHCINSVRETFIISHFKIIDTVNMLFFRVGCLPGVTILLGDGAWNLK